MATFIEFLKTVSRAPLKREKIKLMAWIFGAFSIDAMFIVAPVILSLTIALSGIAGDSIVYALFATALIDSGHVYTTLWRTWWHSAERKSAKLYYLTVPVLVALFFIGWMMIGLPYVWSIVLYATLHHHIRQFYGVSRWYQALNKRRSDASVRFLYAFALLPILAYHFKPGAIDGYYSQSDLFVFPSASTYQTLLFAYAGLVALWIVFEIRTWRKGHHEWNRILSVAIPATLYAGCFFLGKTPSEIVFPLLISHGIAYFALMSHSLVKTRNREFPLFKRAFAVVVITAAVFGGLEAFIEENYISFDSTLTSPLAAVLAGFYLVPLFSHFIFDARIWKNSHREGSLIFTSTGDVQTSLKDTEGLVLVKKIS